MPQTETDNNGKAFASEAGHWYTRTGEPRYTVPSKVNGDRPTTLADARKEGLVPSVTTILKCQDRPALTAWMVDQGIMAAMTLPRVDGETEGQWMARVKDDSRQHAKDAAAKGTAIHAAIESMFATGLPWNIEYYGHAVSALNCVEYATDKRLTEFHTELPFAHPLGFGGKSDLSSPEWVIDFKGKDFCADDIPGLKCYDEHAQQLAAYRHGLGLTDARCAIVYVSRNNPGLVKFCEIAEKDLQRGW